MNNNSLKIGDLVESIMFADNIGIIHEISFTEIAILAKIFWITKFEFYDPYRLHDIKNLKLYGKCGSK